METIIPSLFFYAIVVGFCEICRRGCQTYLKRSSSPWSPQVFLIEAIGALQAITCVYENQLVVKYYGLVGFGIVVFLLILSPAAVSERYLIGQMGSFECLGVVIAELIGGKFGFHLAGVFWRLGLSDQHFVHYKTFDCVLAYKTPIMMVSLYEFHAVLLIRLIIGYVSKHKPKMSPYITSLSISLFLTIGMVLVGPVSLNPLVAYGRFGGCKGISNYDHLITYCVVAVTSDSHFPHKIYLSIVVNITSNITCLVGIRDIKERDCSLYNSCT